METHPKNKILLVTATVDFGTRSIAEVYIRDMNPERIIKIPDSLESMGIKGLLSLRKAIREASEGMDAVVALHHGAIIAVALFAPRHKTKLYAVADWTRVYPSKREDTYARVYSPIMNRILKRFDTFYSPAKGFCDYYQERHNLHVEETLYPLPYPDHIGKSYEVNVPPKLLFIGADYRRKAGDLLLESWSKRKTDSTLTFVCPEPPVVDQPRGIDFLTSIRAGTPEHLTVLKGHDVFALPSRREAFGFSALEALNFGQVVVTSRNVGIAALVEKAGGIVGANPEEAVELALDLLDRPDEIAQRRAQIWEFMLGYDIEFRKGWSHVLQ
jgi:hypothetical protein